MVSFLTIKQFKGAKPQAVSKQYTYLLLQMIGVDYIYFIQKNHLDLKNRVLEIEATNETFAARVSVVEKCRYYVSK